MIFLQSPALPFGKRLDNFQLFSGQILGIKGNRTLNAIEIVIETARLCHKQRGTDPGQIHFFSEFPLECITDILDCFLRMTHIQRRLIIFWYRNFHDLISCA